MDGNGGRIWLWMLKWLQSGCGEMAERVGMDEGDRSG